MDAPVVGPHYSYWTREAASLASKIQYQLMIGRIMGLNRATRTSYEHHVGLIAEIKYHQMAEDYAERLK